MSEPETKRMTLSEHLEELRARVLKALLAVVVAFVVCFVWIDVIVQFLRAPLEPVMVEYGGKLIQIKPFSAFVAAMKVALFAGLVVSSPVIVYQIWAFVGAGLYRGERRTVKHYVLPGVFLFLAGAAMAYYFVLPFALRFLISFAADNMGAESMLDINSYLSLVAFGMFVFGLMFQLPLIMVFLMRIGVVEPDQFRRSRRFAVVGAFFFAMILTPPDVISQLALAGCLLVLYEGAILVGTRLAQPRREE
ncbi:MAG: twin-arginine translocase subunit TatC [Planctomycetota bacterium]|nr:twin-arginine translocase subunit TatC [Planctomycetota bacterium]